MLFHKASVGLRYTVLTKMQTMLYVEVLALFAVAVAVPVPAWVLFPGCWRVPGLSAVISTVNNCRRVEDHAMGSVTTQHGVTAAESDHRHRQIACNYPVTPWY